MKLKLIKVYKCSVKKCTNLVHSKGAFCQACIDKINDSLFNLKICTVCRELINLTPRKTEELDINKRMLLSICPACKDMLLKNS